MAQSPQSFPLGERATIDAIIVVPCFNEARRLDCCAYDAFLDRSPDVMFVFVDDGSTDETPHIVERLRQRRARQVCTLQLAANVGKAEAVRRGLQVALRRQPAFVGYWDADLATPLDVIPRFCQLLRARPQLSLVMGSRVALLGRRIQRSAARHFLGRVFATAASVVLGLPVYDTQCGAKLLRVVPTTKHLVARPFCSRWVFDVELLARLISSLPNGSAAHQQIYEYPLEQWIDVRGSRLRAIDFLISAIDLAGIAWRQRRRAKCVDQGAQMFDYPAGNDQQREAA